MSSILPSTLNPPVQQNPLKFSDETSKSSTAAAIDNKTGSAQKVDFKSLLMNSNEEVAKKRATDNKGDLSKAKNDEEFFKMLEDKTKPQRTPKNTLEKDDFLKLFVTQLKNQDPLNPQDSAAMASQLAQFNSLEQMMNMNKSLDKMNNTQDNNRNWGLVDYIGKEVQVNNGRIIVHGGKLNEIAFNTEKPVAAAELQVIDEAGITVAKKDIGNINVGEHTLDWDGKTGDGKVVSDGSYSFKIVSKTGENEEQIPIKATSKVKITGLDLQDKSGNAFYTTLGKLSLSDISAVGNPGFLEKSKTEEKKNDAAKANDKIDDKANDKTGDKQNFTATSSDADKAVQVAKTEPPAAPQAVVQAPEKSIAEPPIKEAKVEPKAPTPEPVVKTTSPKREEHASLFPEDPFIPASGHVPSQLR